MVVARGRWKEWQDGRSRIAQQRQAEAWRKEEAKGELTRWLEELGLGEYAPLLIAEAIDLDTLQFLCAAPSAPRRAPSSSCPTHKLSSPWLRRGCSSRGRSVFQSTLNQCYNLGITCITWMFELFDDYSCVCAVTCA